MLCSFLGFSCVGGFREFVQPLGKPFWLPPDVLGCYAVHRSLEGDACQGAHASGVTCLDASPCSQTPTAPLLLVAPPGHAPSPAPACPSCCRSWRLQSTWHSASTPQASWIPTACWQSSLQTPSWQECCSRWCARAQPPRACHPRRQQRPAHGPPPGGQALAGGCLSPTDGRTRRCVRSGPRLWAGQRWQLLVWNHHACGNRSSRCSRSIVGRGNSKPSSSTSSRRHRQWAIRRMRACLMPCPPLPSTLGSRWDQHPLVWRREAQLEGRQSFRDKQQPACLLQW